MEANSIYIIIGELFFLVKIIIVYVGSKGEHCILIELFHGSVMTYWAMCQTQASSNTITITDSPFGIDQIQFAIMQKQPLVKYSTTLYMELQL